MIEFRETETFSEWLSGLRDARDKAEVARRIRRLALGNPGDVKPVGEGVSELRIHYGPGYRVYHVQRGNLLSSCSAAVTKAPRPRTSPWP